MNFAQRLGVFCLILISVAYVYFSYFNNDGFNITRPVPRYAEDINTPTTELPEELEVIDIPEDIPQKEHDIKTVKIFISDTNGNLRSVNRECDTAVEKSCFAYAIKQLIQGPTNWEKSKGLSSEIPANTKILSVREGKNNVLIDLSPAFEGGGGAESLYIRINQLIKTAKANTNMPVFLYINGKQADVIGGEGIMIKQPLNERSLND